MPGCNQLLFGVKRPGKLGHVPGEQKANRPVQTRRLDGISHPPQQLNQQRPRPLNSQYVDDKPNPTKRCEV